MTSVEIVEERWRTTLAITVRGPSGHRPSDADVRRAARIMRAQVVRLEDAASRFRPDTEVSEVNRNAGRWVPVSDLLVELVQVSCAAAETTDGLVDPCLGRHVDAAGYRSWAAGEVAGVVPGPVPTPRPGAWREVEAVDGRVRIPEGVSLDLGATAKAWLADEVAERIAEDLGLDVVANMGGDLRAISQSSGWVVTTDHEVPGLPAQSMEITDAGLATSGQGRRRWVTTSGSAHHLIDPRSGRSADTSWWAVTALAATATAANIAATVGMLLDHEAFRWFADMDLDGLFTAWNGSDRASAHQVGRCPQMEGAA